MGFQPRFPRGVLLGPPAVLAPINLDNQPRCETREVDNIRSQGSLSPEAPSLELAFPQSGPEPPLGIGRILTKRTGDRSGHERGSVLALNAGSPHPDPPPRGGREDPERMSTHSRPPRRESKGWG